MEFLEPIFSALSAAWGNSFPWFLPKANSMLASALLSMLVWERYSAAPSVKRFFAGKKTRP